MATQWLPGSCPLMRNCRFRADHVEERLWPTDSCFVHCLSGRKTSEGCRAYCRGNHLVTRVHPDDRPVQPLLPPTSPSRARYVPGPRFSRRGREWSPIATTRVRAIEGILLGPAVYSSMRLRVVRPERGRGVHCLPRYLP